MLALQAVADECVSLARVTGKDGVVAMRDGHLVSRESDFIVYSVEAEYLDSVVKEYGPCEFTWRGHQIWLDYSCTSYLHSDKNGRNCVGSDVSQGA